MRNASALVCRWIWLGSLVLILSFYLPPASHGADEAEITAGEAEERLPGRVTIGGRAGEDEAEGLGDLLIPLWYRNGGLLFFNPRVGVTDNSEQEVQVGLGYRYLFPERELIVGANAFYDSRWSRHDNHYNQAGFGAEILTRWVDARANYYLPERKKNVVDTEESVSVSRSSSTSVSAPFPEQHTFKETVTTRTTTTTTREFFEHYETTARGWDAEIGVWLPIREIIPIDVGLFAGWYEFKPHYGGEKIEGWRGRAEIRLLPSVILDAEVYEDDKLNGTDYWVGGRLQVPFDLAALANGRNPFAGAQEGYKSGSRPFAHRLTENVIRDPAIRTGEDVEKVGEETSTQSSTSTTKNTLVDDVNFVSNQSPGGDGTAERPYNTIQDGVDNAFGQRNVYVFGGGPYNENVVINRNGIRLWGESTPVVGSTGKTFGGNKRPVIDGNVAGVNAPALHITANNVSVIGLDFTHSPGGINPGLFDNVFGTYEIDEVGILAENANRLLLARNNVYGNSYGGLLLTQGSDNYFQSILNNNFFDNSIDGLRLHGQGASGTYEAEIAGNSMNFNDAQGLQVLAANFDFISLAIMNNVSSFNAGHGIDMQLTGNGPVLVSLEDIDSQGNNLFGVNLTATSLGSIFTLMNRVQATANLQNGIQAILSAAGVVSSHFIDVLSDDNGFGGINLQAISGGSPVDITFDGVSANGNNFFGILANLSSGGPIAASLTDVQANDNGQFGVQLLTSTASDTDVVLNNVSANGNSQFGLLASLGGGGSIDASFTDVWANDNGQFGLFANLSSGGPIGASFTGIWADDNGQFGFQLTTSTALDTDVVLNNVSAGGNGQFGLLANLSGAGSIDASFTDVWANDNGQFGLLANLSSGGPIDASFTDVWADDNGQFGFQLLTSTGSDTDVVLDNVSASGNNFFGLFANLSGGGPIDASFTDVWANDNGQFGLQLITSTGSDTDVLFDNLIASDNSQSGLLANLSGGGDANVQLVMSQMNGNGEHGAFLTLNFGSDVNLFGQDNTFRDNGIHGLIVDALAIGALNLDFGGGILGSLGQNSFTDNVNFGLLNQGGGTVSAQFNFWDNNGTDFSAGVDGSNPLAVDPNP